MALDRLKQHIITRLKILSIPIYLIIDVFIWNAGMFFIYGELPNIYGIKAVCAIISFIFFFKYLRRWKADIEVRLASKVILVFFLVSFLGSVLESVIYSAINNSFMYTTVIAIFAATINASFLVCGTVQIL